MVDNTKHLWWTKAQIYNEIEKRPWSTKRKVEAQNDNQHQLVITNPKPGHLVKRQRHELKA